MANERIRNDEKAFLERHGIPEQCVADMRHRADWASCAEFMHPIDCYVAWGFRQCDLGHRLTTARGKCLQCNPASIGFMKGYWTEGYVYLLASQSEEIVKVGWSSDIEKRFRELLSERVGSVSDWQVIRTFLCGQPAALEKALHDRLVNHREVRQYMRHRISREARELFSCSKRTALRAWNEVVASRSEW
jgi:hypothetical protein